MSVPQESNDSQEAPLQVFPAALSMVCPGLGQLTQGRFSSFFGHFLFFVLAAIVPMLFGVVFFTNLSLDRSRISQHEATTLFVFLIITAIFPILLAFFSLLDAATWKNWRAGEKSRLKKHIRYLFASMIAVYVALAFFIPVVFSARGPHPRAWCRNHLTQIALAMHNYHDERGSLPPAFTVDENGKPLHSWRVLILPYLGEDELYRKIRLDEPWDSEYNRQFHSAEPSVFRCHSGGLAGYYNPKFPHLNDEKNSCYYSVVIGEETAFPRARKVKFDEIQDGLTNTVLVVERLVPICWMDPNHEIPYETAIEGVNRSLYGVGSAHPGGANVALCDGSTHFISDEEDQNFWKPVLTIAGNETGPFYKR